MLLSDYLNTNLLAKHVHDGFVRKQTHPSLPLDIYNYTEQAQFTATWDDVTRKCRALVVDEGTGKVVARGYEKFFNYSEHANSKSYAPPLPKEAFIAYEKVDGSLILLFYAYHAWRVASRGSFTSDQARTAMAVLSSDYDWIDENLNRDFTYVTEIVYPENRIVVDYGDKVELVLHGIFNNKTLEEVPLYEADPDAWETLSFGRIVKTYPFNGGIFLLDHLASGSNDIEGNFVRGVDAEGYVIRFQSGVRCKVKFNDYVHLHKIITNCTEKSVWETLSSGGTLNDLYDGTPDEFRDWLNDTVTKLYGQYNEFIGVTTDYYNKVSSIVGLDPSRGEFARTVLTGVPKPYQGGVFNLLDHKPLTELAWKSCKPTAASKESNA